MLAFHYKDQAMPVTDEQNAPQWYAVQTKSRFEKSVNAALQAKGVETFLPLVREIHQWKDRKKVVDVPLFCGYVIARLVDCPEERIRVAQTHGVARILSDGNAITPIAQAEIEAVKQLITAREHIPYPYLREGVRVRVQRGPLAGLEGFLVRIKNSSRLVISMNLIAQSVAAEIDIADVKVIS